MNIKDSFGIVLALCLSTYSGYLLTSEKDVYLEPTGKVIGKVVELNNFVKHKSKDNLSWKGAKTNLELRTDDMIFTEEDSSAIVLMNSSSKIEIGPNTLVRISEMTDTITFNLEQGVIDVIFAKGVVSKKIALGGRIIQAKKSGAKIKLKRDKILKEDTVTVVKGEVTVLDIKLPLRKVSLKKNERAIIKKKSRVIEKEVILITSIFPKNNKRFKTYDNVPVSFKWNRTKKILNSALVIKGKTVDKRVVTSKDEYTVSLQPGFYSWRVEGEHKGKQVKSNVRYFVVKKLPPFYKLKVFSFKPHNGYSANVTSDKKFKMDFSWNYKAYAGKEKKNLDFEFSIIKKEEEEEDKVIKIVNTKKSNISVELDKTGEYYWQVRPRSENYKKYKMKKRLLKVKYDKPPAPKIKKKIELDVVTPMDEQAFIQKILNIIINSAHAADDNVHRIAWRKVKGIKKYQILIEDAEGNKVVNETIDSNVYKWKAEKHGKYTYRVASIDRFGITGEFSRPGILVIKEKVFVAPKILVPENKAMKAGQNVLNLSWEKSVYAKSHEIVVTTKADGGDEIFREETSDTKFNLDVKQFRKYGEIFWKIVTTFPNGKVSSKVSRIVFPKVKNAPLALVSPKHAVKFKKDDKITFKWKEISGVEDYKFSIRTKIAGPSIFEKTIDDDSIDVEVEDLKGNAKLYWVVTAEKDGNSYKSKHRAFFTPKMAVSGLELIGPENNKLFPSKTKVLFEWKEVKNAKKYLFVLMSEKGKVLYKKKTSKDNFKITLKSKKKPRVILWKVSVINPTKGLKSETRKVTISHKTELDDDKDEVISASGTLTIPKRSFGFEFHQNNIDYTSEKTGTYSVSAETWSHFGLGVDYRHFIKDRQFLFGELAYHFSSAIKSVQNSSINRIILNTAYGYSFLKPKWYALVYGGPSLYKYSKLAWVGTSMSKSSSGGVGLLIGAKVGNKRHGVTLNTTFGSFTNIHLKYEYKIRWKKYWISPGAEYSTLSGTDGEIKTTISNMGYFVRLIKDF